MNSKILVRFIFTVFATLLAGAVSMAQPTGTQAVLTGTSDWLGVNSNYFDAANWSSGVPTGNTDIRLLSESPVKTLNITHSGTGNRQVDIYSIRTAANYAYTINLESTSSGTLTYNITGRGTHPFNTNGDGTSTGNTANRLNFYITMGNNTIMTFAPDAFLGYEGNTSTPATSAANVPLPGRSTSGLTYAFITMTGNAVLDFRTMDNYYNVSAEGVIQSQGTALTGGFNIGEDAVVYLGTHRGTLSQGLNASMEERWEGLLIQEEYDPLVGLPATVGMAALPDGVTADMLHSTAVSLQSEKWGAGITRITTTGTVIHPGNMRLRAAGGYVVDGYHRGPILADASGAWVGGKGNIYGTVTVNSVSSITGGDKNAAGNLTINGALVLNGSLSIDLTKWDEENSIREWDHIQINGDLTIGATGKLAVGRSEEFPLMPGTFRVLDYTGDMTGAFESVALPQSQGLAASYAWVGKGLELTFTQLAFADNPNLTGNYNSMALLIDTAVANGTVPNAILNTLNRQPSIIYFKQVLDQLSPMAYQSWFPSAVLRTNSLVQTIEDQMFQDVGYGRAKGTVQTYLQGWRQESSRDADASTTYSNYDTYSILAGVDYAISDSTVAGGYIAYETTEFDLDDAGGNTDNDGYVFGVYARHTMGNWQFNATALYGTDDYSSERYIGMTDFGTWAKSDTDGKRFAAAVSAAYTFKLPWLEATPVAGLQWTKWKADGFTETGSEAANLIVESQSATSFQARLGARLSRSFESKRGVIRPFLHMAYVREFKTGKRDITAELFEQPITIKVPGIEANGMRVDAGVDWDITKSLRAGLRYTAQYNNASDESMGIRANITFTF